MNKTLFRIGKIIGVVLIVGFVTCGWADDDKKTKPTPDKPAKDPVAPVEPPKPGTPKWPGPKRPPGEWRPIAPSTPTTPSTPTPPATPDPKK
jgi:hypothetical protein